MPEVAELSLMVQRLRGTAPRTTKPRRSGEFRATGLAGPARSTRREHGNAGDARLVLGLQVLTASGRNDTWTGSVPLCRHGTARIDYRLAVDPSQPIPIVVHKPGGREVAVAAYPAGAG